MSKLDQLIAKALSTDSEEEAMTCLRFARKHAKTEKAGTAPTQKKPTPESYEIQHLRDQVRTLKAMYADSSTRAQYFMEQMTQVQLDRLKVNRKLYRSEQHVNIFKMIAALLAVSLITTIMVLL